MSVPGNAVPCPSAGTAVPVAVEVDDYVPYVAGPCPGLADAVPLLGNADYVPGPSYE